MKKRRKKIDPGSLVLDIVVYSVMIFSILVTIYPVWFVLVASFASSAEVQLSGGLMLWPKKFLIGAYEVALQNRLIVSGFLNSVKLLIMSLPINIIMTLIAGYFMATSRMMFKKPLIWMMLFTMYFSGGLVPQYLNITRDLGLMDSQWALVLPGALSVYNSIICKTAIEGMPDSLRESAYLDGATHLQTILKIVMPLIKPTLAVLLLYYGLSTWNSWFTASLYIRDQYKYPIQMVIREFIVKDSNLSEAVAGGQGDTYDSYAETIKYAAMVISTFPVMCVYPFLQKHFTKGVMIGAVKG